jgi:hypothetical protein
MFSKDFAQKHARVILTITSLILFALAASAPLTPGT